jgi:hypothetical protein
MPMLTLGPIGAQTCRIIALVSLLCAGWTHAATQSATVPVVAKWGRFERPFRSTLAYSNALQDVTLSIVFTSPLGETNQIYGFWDGSRVWKVRFAPNLPGRWTFRTTCSDTANKGLHNQSGEFLCAAATGKTLFGRHGPVRVARDRHHLEHADGTSFFWFADTAWEGAQLSQPGDWEAYARTRSQQKFTVIQWAAASGRDVRERSAFSGKDRIAINPEFFKRLDAKLEALTRANLLSAIAPFAPEPTTPIAQLPDHQAAVMARYMVARWGADPVAWLITAPADQAKASRLKTVGRALFSDEQLVVMNVGDSHELTEECRDQQWIDAFAYQSLTGATQDGPQRLLTGPLAKVWKNEPARPLIALLPYENATLAGSGERVSADQLRRSAYWSLCITPLAGITYGAQPVVNWEGLLSTQAQKTKQATVPEWQKALFLPGARQASPLLGLTSKIECWKLRPQPQLIANQPSAQAPQRFITAAATAENDLAVVYVPQDRNLELTLEALPPSPIIGWLNPRTGENSPAVAVVGGRTCQFPTPDPGDWLLIMKAGK